MIASLYVFAIWDFYVLDSVPKNPDHNLPAVKQARNPEAQRAVPDYRQPANRHPACFSLMRNLIGP